MKKLFGFLCFFLFAATAAAQIPAFPGAEGAGADSVGGRGGKVYTVTNLSDGGTGSLRFCIEASGPRTCVFAIAGKITNYKRLGIKNPYITIAGQTAPGEIVLQSAGSAQCTTGDCGTPFISTHDVIIRYVTYDGSAATPTGPDTGTNGFEMTSGNVYNVILDHLSCHWWGNACVDQFSNDGGTTKHNTTQWSMFYEPNKTHPIIIKLDATSGSALKSIDYDFHHNFGANADRRWPLSAVKTFRWVNNILYNFGQDGDGDFYSLSWGGANADYIGNIYRDGPNTGTHTHPILANHDNAGTDASNNCNNGFPCDNPGPPFIYLLGNIGHSCTSSVNGCTIGTMTTPTNVVNDSGQKLLTSQGWEGAETSHSGITLGPWPSSWYRSTPLPTENFPITYTPVGTNGADLEALMLDHVGNYQRLKCDGTWLASRDAADARVIAQYRARGAGTWFIGQYSTPSIPAGTPCQISLGDGIPDAWKVANNLSTTDTSLYQKTAPNGYTFLENFINGTGPASSGGGTGSGGTTGGGSGGGTGGGGGTSGTPDFSDTFSTGSMDTTKWQVNSYTQPNYVGAGSTFTSTPSNCSWAGGLLTLRLDQPTASTSTGCELQSKIAFGLGTYEFIFRASSTATTPAGAGTADSGSISTGFIISDQTSKTEIDSPEIEGQTPTHVEFTNWLNGVNDGAAIITAGFNPQDAQHKFRFVWNSGSVTYYIDDVQVAQHTTDVPLPSNPGFVILSHYGTNSSGFGGTATVGVTRYMYVTSFKYWSQTGTGGGTSGGGGTTPTVGAPDPPTALTATPH
jgi:hypothetical protein